MYELYTLENRLLKSYDDRALLIEVLKLLPKGKTKVLIKEFDMFILSEDYVILPRVIGKFKPYYEFLSNFFEHPIHYRGLLFMSNEAAFQAQKDLSKSNLFCMLSPGSAKHLGKSRKDIKLRDNWNTIKYGIMYEIVKEKFTSNNLMKKLLLLTGDSKLVEGNTWSDYDWGVCNGTGKNNLGIILMRVREDIAISEERDVLL